MLAKVIVILGPTAAGKSDLAFQIAKKYNAEIIAADSRQVYKEASIGTNKDNGAWQVYESNNKYYTSYGIRVHCIDFLSPEKLFTVYEYKKMAVAAIKDVVKRGSLPMLIGGTGFYIDAVIDNWKLHSGSFNKKLRKELEDKPNIELLKKLEKIDPVKARAIDQHNKIRLIRALEIYYLTGETMSDSPPVDERLFNVLKVGITQSRDVLHKRIAVRVDNMIASGLVLEVKRLKEKYNSELPIFKSIGYRQLLAHLDGKMSLEEAIELIKRDTRRYVRRQLTWWRRDEEIKWCDNFEEADKLIKKFLQ